MHRSKEVRKGLVGRNPDFVERCGCQLVGGLYLDLLMNDRRTSSESCLHINGYQNKNHGCYLCRRDCKIKNQNGVMSLETYTCVVIVRRLDERG